MIDQLLCFGICDVFVCIALIASGFSYQDYVLSYNIIHVVQLVLMIMYVVLQGNKYFRTTVRITYLLIIILICQLLQIEFLKSNYEPEYIFFITIRMLILIYSFKPKLLRSIIFFIIFAYLLIRGNFYSNIFTYTGLAFFVCTFFSNTIKENKETELLNFFQETIPCSMLVLNVQLNQVLFHSNKLETELNYNKENENNFLSCLMQFQDCNQTTLITCIQQFQYPLTQIRSDKKFKKIQEINCAEFTYIESIVTNHNRRILTQLQFSHDRQELINIESPKCQQEALKQVSNPSLEDGHLISQGRKYSQYRDYKKTSNNLNQLKQKRLYIEIIYCIFMNEPSYLIILKDLECDIQIAKLQDEVEEQRKQNENKDQLLATVFHDFKTPINGICAIIETMEEVQQLNTKQKYFLRIIRKNVYLMLYMITDILDFARIQKNQLRLTVTEFYLNEVIDEVIEIVALQAEQKGVTISAHYDIPSYLIYSDSNRIKQILMNFISNSLKFTESGSITITVESPHSDKTSHIVKTQSSRNVFNQQNQHIGQLRKQLSGKSIKQGNQNQRMIYNISITDTGCGISESIKPKLFNMYATFASQFVPNKCGTGIGLVVCKKLIKLLGPSDKIDLWSEINKGTKMSFSIYSRLPDDPKRSPNYISVFKQENSSKNFNIDSQSSIIEETQHIQQQQKFVRSSVLRVFQRSTERNDTDCDFPENEDVEQSKCQNIHFMHNLKSPSVSKTKGRELDDSQDVIDPRIRLKKLIKEQTFSILIVDDQPFNVLAIKLLLQDISQSITFIEAFNGQQAIQKLQLQQQKDNIKYVFMDLFMPILNGWDAAKQMKEMMNKKIIDQVKIVAISGYDDESEQDRCFNIGFDAFLTKPVKLEMIAEVFAQLNLT